MCLLQMSPESVADLVDLEQELSSLQRGITQMERITPNEPGQSTVGNAAGKAVNEDDPFGDSFTNFPVNSFLVLSFIVQLRKAFAFFRLTISCHRQNQDDHAISPLRQLIRQ